MSNQKKSLKDVKKNVKMAKVAGANKLTAQQLTGQKISSLSTVATAGKRIIVRP